MYSDHSTSPIEFHSFLLSLENKQQRQKANKSEFLKRRKAERVVSVNFETMSSKDLLPGLLFDSFIHIR